MLHGKYKAGGTEERKVQIDFAGKTKLSLLEFKADLIRIYNADAAMLKISSDMVKLTVKYQETGASTLKTIEVGTDDNDGGHFFAINKDNVGGNGIMAIYIKEVIMTVSVYVDIHVKHLKQNFFDMKVKSYNVTITAADMQKQIHGELLKRKII